MDFSTIDRVSSERLRHDLFFFCRDPFTFRTVMYTAPWHEKNSLDETDDAIEAEMKKFADSVTRFPNKVQAFRCNPSKPLHHWYDGPHDDDPWYDANNIEVVFRGTDKADEIIQLVSHKDSMSWINSPGAQDNATGLVANMELARIVSALPRRRTIRFLFCNEEHTPWHSRTYAKAARERGDNIIAVLNQYPEAIVSITGYADKETGTAKRNMALSKERAERVTQCLIDAGIAADRITSNYYGDTIQVSDVPEENRVSVCVTR